VWSGVTGRAARQDAYETPFDRYETPLDRDEATPPLEAHVDRLEARMDRLEAAVDRLEAALDRIEAKMDWLERMMRRWMVGLRRFWWANRDLRTCPCDRRPAGAAHPPPEPFSSRAGERPTAAPPGWPGS
jgi:hypothetical protein